MGKQSVQAFDPDVCMGQRADVDGPCPLLKEKGESTGRPLVDRLAEMEGAVLSGLSGGSGLGPEDFKCGGCGCPLPNIQLTLRVPDNCPRVAEHEGLA